MSLSVKAGLTLCNYTRCQLRAYSGEMARRRSKGTDPALSAYHWVKVIRPYWVARKLPCARCGGGIDYGSRYVPGTNRKRVNPRSLVVGHIVGRHQARLLGWTEAQTHALSNTQPEHARCSDQSGARYGNKLRLVVNNRPPTDDSREW